MSFGFLNAVMLLGLAGAALPVLVHLLSRRNYDVVAWGAMQFLELGRRTRRRIRLEELLLLLLRIGLVCLLALALARPWAKGGLFSKLTRTTPRDVAVVIDGSYSMGWEGKAVTPHAAAVQWTHELLEELGGGDTVILLDARDGVRLLTERPTADFGTIRTLLDALPPPSGTSSLPRAGIKAAQVLAQGEHLDRDIILLSDGQSFAWTPENGAAWRQFDETLRQSSVPPHVWAVDVAGQRADNPVNFTVERLKLSRELTVPGFPLRIETTVRQWGGSPARREVSFAVNGQRQREKSVIANLPADGEATFTFEHRFDKVGSYVINVMLEPDALPGDNRSDAAVVVEHGIPVLLVDGNRQRDPTLSETFFISAALTPARSDAPWVMATVIEPGQLSPQALEGQRAVFLANVPRVTEEQVALLETFVAAGGGLVVAPGDLIDAESYNRDLYADGRGLLPARFDVIKHERDHQLGDVNVAGDSLEVSWLARFRPESGVDLTEARFAHWWRMEPALGVHFSGFGGEDKGLAGRSSPAGGTGEPTGEHENTSSNAERPTPTADPLIAARLDTGDPFLISRTFGEGSVLELAAPLDGDWSTLPSKNDFVPLVHELVFHLASRTAGRNVESGMPLVLDVAPGSDNSAARFLAPDGRALPAEAFDVAGRSRIGLRETDLPGIYRFQPTGETTAATEYFVVHSDRRESDLTRLAPPDRDRLAANDRIRFVSSLNEIVAGMADDQVPSELWRMLFFAVLALLVAEVLLTRRLVQGGHEAIDDAVPDERP